MSDGPPADFASVPVIDVSALVGDGDRHATADQLGRACREVGFFYVVGHGVDDGMQRRLESLSREFFARDPDAKMRVRMALGGRACDPDASEFTKLFSRQDLGSLRGGLRPSNCRI